MKRLFIIVVLVAITVFLPACSSPATADAPTPTPETTPVVTPAPPTPTPEPTPTPAPAFPAKGYCNGEGVNLRGAPAKDSAIVDILGENTVLELVSLENGWYQVNYRSSTAYIAEELVELGDPPRKDNMHYAKFVKDSQLYKTPDDKNPSDVKAKQGEAVKVLRKIGDYSHVVYKYNLQRYVKSANIEIITEEEALKLMPSPSPAS